MIVIDYAGGGEVISWDEKKCRFYLNPAKYKKKAHLEEEFIRFIFRDCVKGLDYSMENQIYSKHFVKYRISP